MFFSYSGFPRIRRPAKAMTTHQPALTTIDYPVTVAIYTVVRREHARIFSPCNTRLCVFVIFLFLLSTLCLCLLEIRVWLNARYLRTSVFRFKWLFTVVHRRSLTMPHKGPYKRDSFFSIFQIVTDLNNFILL